MSAPTFCEIQSDLHHLKHLVDTFADILIDMDRDGIPDAAHTEIDRIESLVWIGRDRVNELVNGIERRFRADMATRNAEVDIITAEAAVYAKKLAAWTRAATEAEANPDSAAHKVAEEAAEKAHDDGRDVLFTFQPTTPAGFAEKATVLLRIWNTAEGMSDERVVQLLRSMGGRT